MGHFRLNEVHEMLENFEGVGKALEVSLIRSLFQQCWILWELF